MRIEQNENLEKTLFDWVKRMQMNNFPISGTTLKEKSIIYTQELRVEKFHASNGWLKRCVISFEHIQL